MKKLFLSLVVFIVTATAMHAQNSMVATLSHDDDITMYYGVYALRDAMNAAESGDVINLSGGAFQAMNISKGVTLRGTGIDDAAPTYISGDFTINVPSDDANRLSMEGIRCTGTITMKGTFNNPYFVKSAFYAFRYTDSPTINNAVFVDCRISSYYILSGNSTAQFVNSYINGFNNNNETNTAASFFNCVIQPSDRGYHPQYIINSKILNCIIYQTFDPYNRSDQIPSTTIATNCVSIGYSRLFDALAANTDNKQVGCEEFSKVFKNFTGTYSESQQFELTDEAKTTYLGTDGTEVGMHGGLMPYDTTPSYPQITKMNVANKTTADGKLSVEIEVNAAQ